METNNNQRNIIIYFFILSILTIGGNITLGSVTQPQQSISTDTQKIKIEVDEKNIQIFNNPTEKDDSLLKNLEPVWIDAFNTRYIQRPSNFGNLYMSNIYPKYDLVAYIYNKKPISMLTLIPCYINNNGTKIEGYYVFAVGTKKEYQGQGLATDILKYAKEYAKKNNKLFCVLIPTEDEDKIEKLMNFYRNRNYEDIYLREISLSKKDMEDLAKDSNCMNYTLGIDAADLKKARFQNLSSNTIYIEWDETELQSIRQEYLRNHHKIYEELWFEDNQYAIVDIGTDYKSIKDEKWQKIRIEEFYIKDENKKMFLKTIMNRYPSENYIFSVPDSDIFSNSFEKEYSRKIFPMINFIDSPKSFTQQRQKPIYFKFGME